MTCDECFEAVSASVDGELPGDQSEAMHLHLDDCADCQRLRERLLSLSAEMKVQPFPEPGPAQVQSVLEAAVSSLTTSRWSALLRLLRCPWESAPWRHGLRLASFGGAAGLAAVALIVRWILPPLSGTEATALGSVPAPFWGQLGSALPALAWLPLLVMLLAAWTGGWPALLSDLHGETRVQPGQVAAAAAGLALAGPFAAVPLLAGLEVGAYVLVCCLWTGICLLAAFAIIAFKTTRPLPRLALDFAVLVLPLALLESLARAGLALPQASEYQPAIAHLVGTLPFPTICAALGLLALSMTLLGAGLVGTIPTYRGAGGRALGLLLLIAGLGCLGYGFKRAYNLGSGSMSSRVRLETSRQAYLLSASEANPWLLPALAYPRLEVESGGDPRPRSRRLAVASAYLDWDEEATLDGVRNWAENAPGVAWGLSAFVDSLGRRQNPVELTLPSEERQKLVNELIHKLRWRVLATTALSSAPGSVHGRLVDARGHRQGLRLRLIEVKGDLSAVEAGLASEAAWAEKVADGDDLAAGYSLPVQRTAVTDAEGEFTSSRVPAGRYVLAFLPEQASPLTVNPSLPGIFEVGEGKLTLEPVRLSDGGQAEELPLQPGRWQAQGAVEFALSADGPSATMARGAVLSTLIDDHPFDSGSAHLKVLMHGGPEARVLLKLTLLSKDGRRQSESEQEVGQGLSELEIASRGREGYLQVVVLAISGNPRLKAARLEVRP